MHKIKYETSFSVYNFCCCLNRKCMKGRFLVVTAITAINPNIYKRKKEKNTWKIFCHCLIFELWFWFGTLYFPLYVKSNFKFHLNERRCHEFQDNTKNEIVLNVFARINVYRICTYIHTHTHGRHIKKYQKLYRL